MYSLEELKTWWEIPAIAHFFSLFKSCFALTDFTIEELEESLLNDGEDDKATAFTSRLLTELLQGCYNNPNISLATYHESLIHIMKKRWEEEDGRVNPMSSINADFHSLPTQLKVQIIHRLTEYRLDANDVDAKLSGLNPSDLRLEPLGVDRNGSKYWYFFGVRLYKETPPLVKKLKKRKHEGKAKKKESKKPKLHSGTISQVFLKLVNGESRDDDGAEFGDPARLFRRNCGLKEKRSKKKLRKRKKKGKHRQDDIDDSGFRRGDLHANKWEVVCYNVNDWEKLAEHLSGGDFLAEEALCRLITDNFLPNLPKIVEDMEVQRLHKEQMEQLPRRSSCRLLAKKLYEEEDGINMEHVETLKREQKEREELHTRERDERMASDFERMLDVELKRKKKESYTRWKKEREEWRKRRLVEGLPPESESSSDDAVLTDNDLLQSRLASPTNHAAAHVKENKSAETSAPGSADVSAAAVQKRRGRPPAKKESEKNSKVKKSRGRPKTKEKSSKSEEVISNDEESSWEGALMRMPVGDHSYDAMKKAWEVLDTHSEAWPFQKPVEEWYAPGYHEIVQTPMDLSCVELKLIERKYKFVSEFKDDIVLMFDNCRLYNGSDSEYSELADDLEKLFYKTLRTALTKKKKVAATTGARRKPGRPKKNPANEPPAFADTSVAMSLPEDAHCDLDLDSHVETSDEESSDEFTPPGVSKSKLRRSRLESAGRGRPSVVGRGRGRGRGRRMSNPPGVRPSRDDSNESASDPSSAEEKEEVSRGQALSSRGRGRGRGGKSKRGRPSIGERRRSSHVTNKSDGESSDNSATQRSITSAPKRGRGRPPKGRGRGRRMSTTASQPSTSDASSASDESANNSESDDNAEPSATDLKKSDVILASPSNSKSALDTSKSETSRTDKSPARDGETSSSSSRASSRSHSPDKPEKAGETTKAGPIMWSLDYLALQARVLDEKVKQSESNTTVSRKHSQPGNSDKIEPKRPKPSPMSRRVSRDSKGRELSSERVAVPSPRDEASRSFGKRSERSDDYNRKSDGDVYSFNEEDSPANMLTRKTEEPAQKQTNVSIATRIASTPQSTDSMQKLTSLTPPNDSSTDLASDAATDHRALPSKNRHLSSDQLSSPMTPSSGYGSVRAPSSIPGHTSSSPYSASDNSVGLSKSVDKPSPAKTSQNEADKTAAGEKSVAKQAIPDERARSLSSTNQSFKDEIQRAKLLPSTMPSPFSRDAHSSPAPQRPLNSASAQLHASSDERPTGVRTNTMSVQQTSPYQPKSSGVSTVPFSTVRRPSQSIGANQHSMSSPGYQQLATPPSNQSATPSNQSAALNNSKSPAPMRQHSKPGPSLPSAPPTQSSTPQRLPSYGSQPPESSLPSDPGRGSNKASSSVSQQAPPHGYDRQLSNRSTENYRSPGSAGGPHQQPSSYVFNKSSSGSNPNLSGTPSSRDTTSYHARGSVSAGGGVNMISQSPTMASFGLTPQSFSQPHHDDVTGHVPGPAAQNQPTQRKNSIQTGQSSSYPVPKSSSHLTSHHPAPQHGSAMQQRSSHYHAHNPPTSLPSSTNQQPPHPPTNPQHPPSKHRSASSGGGNSSSETSTNKHVPRHANAGSTNQQTHTPPTAVSSNRRQSGNATAQYQQKQSLDYPTNYHIPPSSSATPREGRSYTPHQQNGLLSATTGSASATLRALQQQHKAERPSPNHAAASMLHYAAAAAQQTQAASEQYNRLAATAHRHATSQHAHPLAGVYHPHQNVSTTSPHQTAAHLSSPWLQAAAANPATGYPGNLLAPAHMDPVYQLMQQSGMHGQYPMYPNHVMQQLHQQHLQHHMLPKY